LVLTGGRSVPTQGGPALGQDSQARLLLGSLSPARCRGGPGRQGNEFDSVWLRNRARPGSLDSPGANCLKSTGLSMC